MAKHSSPPVELEDVHSALPSVALPLAVVVTLHPERGGVKRFTGAVELVYYTRTGGRYTYKRWGPPGAPKTAQAMLNGLLLAAMDCNLWVSKVDPSELRKAVEWEMATL